MFRNYLIAKRTYKPDFFLYENNKSMSKAIREKITEELGVEPVLINSALVSAQNRQRLYWTDIPGVTQPEDRGILLRDIIEGYETRAEKVPLSAPVTPQAFPIRPATNPTRAVRSGCVYYETSPPLESLFGHSAPYPQKQMFAGRKIKVIKSKGQTGATTAAVGSDQPNEWSFLRQARILLSLLNWL